MSNEITRENVQAALDRNAANLKDAALEAQEQQLRRTISNNHTALTMSEAQREQLKKLAQKQRQEARAEAIRHRRRDREAARQAEVVQAMKADAAVRLYALTCLVILLASAVTNLPLWAGVTLALGLMAVLAAYIYRLYVPLEVDKK